MNMKQGEMNMPKLTREQIAIETGEKLVNWIKDYFADNGNPETNAIIGMSGGKDSLIAAALCVKALGKDRVIGVMMPDGEQKDISDARAAITYLGFDGWEINIRGIVEEFYGSLGDYVSLDNSVITNVPPRVRMTVLYGLAAGANARVVNTSNRSERYVGWTTKWGDSVGDLAPLAELTVRELLDIGKYYLDLPKDLLFKTPDDGMSGKSDEEALGFSYEELDDYILDNKYPSAEKLALIKKRHKESEHKRNAIPAFSPYGYFFRPSGGRF